MWVGSEVEEELAGDGGFAAGGEGGVGGVVDDEADGGVAGGELAADVVGGGADVGGVVVGEADADGVAGVGGAMRVKRSNWEEVTAWYLLRVRSWILRCDAVALHR